MIGRTEELDTGRPNLTKAVPKCLGHARLAHPRGRRQKNHLTLAVSGTRPAFPQYPDLIDAANQGCHTHDGSSGEAAVRTLFGEDHPGANRRWQPLENLWTEVLVAESAAGEGPGRFGDDDGIGGRKRLQPRSEVDRLSDGNAIAGLAFADQLADDHRPRGDADAKPWEGVEMTAEGTSRLDQSEPRENGPCRGVFVRLWIAEIDQGAVAHVLGNRTAERCHGIGASSSEIGEDSTEIFRIEPRRQFRGPDEVTKHHGQVSTLRRLW